MLWVTGLQETTGSWLLSIVMRWKRQKQIFIYFVFVSSLLFSVVLEGNEFNNTLPQMQTCQEQTFTGYKTFLCYVFSFVWSNLEFSFLYRVRFTLSFFVSLAPFHGLLFIYFYFVIKLHTLFKLLLFFIFLHFSVCTKRCKFTIKKIRFVLKFVPVLLTSWDRWR